MIVFLMTVALAIGGVTLAAVMWSIVRPNHRIWPPKAFSPAMAIMCWGGTLAFFGAVIGLGILGWGGISLPNWLRYGVGPVLIVAGNAGVWFEVAGFGVDQTMGAEGELKTGGLYRYSRNPQYVCDIAILVGFGLLSASALALPAILVGITVLIAFPFAEESWLEERYGAAYFNYRSIVRRFF